MVPGVLVLLDGLEAGAILQLDGLKERVLSAEEVFQRQEGVGRGLIKDDFLAGVEFEAMDDTEDCAIGVDSFLRDFLVLQELFGLVLEAEFALVGLGVVLGEKEAVDGVLQPVGGHVVGEGAVALLGDLGLEGLELRLGSFMLLDFLGILALGDDNVFVLPVLRKNEDSGVGALGDLAGVAVAGKDLNLVGFLVRDRG